MLDLGWASRDMLRAVVQAFGIGGDDKVDRFLQLRRGPDGIDGTTDDFQSGGAQGRTTQGGAVTGSLPPEVQTALGLNQQQLQQIPGLTFGFKNTLVFRVTSVGRSGDITRTIQMIVLKGGSAGGRPQIMSWKEL